MSYKLDLSALDRESAVSITGQLVGLVRDAVESGTLAPGDKLPTTRALAAEAAVNHLTVARAYRRLAEDGYVTGTVGRGTFVRQTPPRAEPVADGRWQCAVLPEQRQTAASQAIWSTWRPPGGREHVNLAIGWASPELHPTDEFARISQDVFKREGAAPLMYGELDGLWGLREELARRGHAEGFASSPDEILITTGARQAIDLVCRTILRPGDVAVTESPTYVGALESLQRTGARVLGVSYDEQGLDVEALEVILSRHEVKLVALQTGSQNPTGQDLSPARAERLLALARERSFFIVEDGVYCPVRFGEPTPSRLRLRAPDHVVYVDSLSKTIGGGLRVGWIAARGELRRRLTELKASTDYHGPMLPQYLTQRWLASGAHDRHVSRINKVYRSRAAAMVDALQRRLRDEVVVAPPRGGHHVWLVFRRPLDERQLSAEALRQGVSFTPGEATTAAGSGECALRLSFSLLDEEQIDEGVRRLAAAVREVRRTSGSRFTTAIS